MFTNATLSATSLIISHARSQLPKLRSALVLSSRPLTVSNDDEENISANYQDIANKEPYYPPPPEPFVSVWGEKVECCPEGCSAGAYRHDILFLKSQPKRYTRTWVEPEPVREKKKVCGPIMEPEVHMRDRRAAAGAKGPCKGDQYRMGLMTCVPPPKLDDPCYKLRVPGCKPPRLPPKCHAAVVQECCQKRCTLYPSYSECNMPKPPVKPPQECTCNKVPNNCEVFQLFKKFPVK